MRMTPHPIPDAYWAQEGKLLAGPYPFLDCATRPAKREAIHALLRAGVCTVVDLRTPAEPPSVRSLLGKLNAEATWIGMPILDGAAPNQALMESILDAMDASIARGRPVYVHCQGGRGRTGTVVACWWIRHGHFDPAAAVEALMQRRAGQPNGARMSPETGAQARLVKSWRPGA